MWADWVVESLRRDLQFQYAAVLVAAPGQSGLRVVAERWGVGAEAAGVSSGGTLVPLEGSVCGAVLRSAAPALIADVRLSTDYMAIPGEAMRSELAVPILVAGAAIGVINLESRRVAAFEIADLDRVLARAAEAGAAAPLAELAAG